MHAYSRPVARWVVAVALALGVALACGQGKSSREVNGTGTATAPSASTAASGNGSVATGTASVLFGAPVPSVSVSSEAMAADAGPPAPPFTACDETRGTGARPLFDDFESGDGMLPMNEGRGSEWGTYDDVGGPDFSVDLEYVVESSGARAGSKVAHATGIDVPHWGGFAVYLTPDPLEDAAFQCSYDASIYTGFRFWIKNTSAVRFKVSTPSTMPVDFGGTCTTTCWGDHGLVVAASEEWVHVEVLFDDFVQPSWAPPTPFTPDAMALLTFEVTDVPDFDVWVDDIEFYGAADAGVDQDATLVSALDSGSADADATSPDTTRDASELDAGAVDTSVVDAGDAE